MRQLFLPFISFLIILGFNGCADEVIIVHDDPPRASVVFDFWAGARNVEVDGEIFNDGRSYIESVEVEILMYDEFGQYISSVFQTFFVDMPSQSSYVFATDIRQSYVYDVDVVIHRLW